jgi:hypothetical protein
VALALPSLSCEEGWLVLVVNLSLMMVWPAGKVCDWAKQEQPEQGAKERDLGSEGAHEQGSRFELLVVVRVS